MLEILLNQLGYPTNLDNKVDTAWIGERKEIAPNSFPNCHSPFRPYITEYTF